MFYTSLVKFANRKTSTDGRPLHWSRADTDGAPFRGTMPFMTEDEYEQKVVRVGDPKVAFFDMTDPDARKAYLDVVDGIVNKWYELVFIQRFLSMEPPLHYVEWIEYFYEDGTRAPYGQPSGGQVNGQQSPHPLFFGPPSPPHEFPPDQGGGD